MVCKHSLTLQSTVTLRLARRVTVTCRTAGSLPVRHEIKANEAFHSLVDRYGLEITIYFIKLLFLSDKAC